MVTVELALGAGESVTIPIDVTHNGAGVDDYSGLPSSVTFNSGDTEATFTIAAIDDSENDNEESLTLRFGMLPDGINPGSPFTTTINLVDNDLPQVSFGAAAYVAIEGGSAVMVTVELDEGLEQSATVPITVTHNGGASEDDYSGVPASVTFNSGDTEKTFAVTATDDSVDDDGESMTLRFGTLPTGLSAGSPAMSIVSLQDNDVPSVTVSYEQSMYSVGEGSNISVKVVLSANPERTVTIPIARTLQGGASDADYSVVPTSLTFNSGDTEKSFTFTAAQDTVDDDGESVKLAFGTLPTRVSDGTNSEATVTITDDDDPEVDVSYGQSTYFIRESSNVSIKVVLSADPERTVTIPITRTNQDGATDADYSGVPSSLTFNSGDTEKSFIFSATLDDEDDDEESVIVGFGTLPTRVSAGARYTATVRMLHEDPCGVAGRNGQEIGYQDGQDIEFRKVFGPRLYKGYPEGDRLGWKEPIRGLYSLWCYRVEIRTRGQDDSNYGSWEEFAAAVYDPPPPGNWTYVNLGPRPSCTDRQYRVRLVYNNGDYGPWAKSEEWLHSCGGRWDWWGW